MKRKRICTGEEKNNQKEESWKSVDALMRPSGSDKGKSSGQRVMGRHLGRVLVRMDVGALIRCTDAKAERQTPR